MSAAEDLSDVDKVLRGDIRAFEGLVLRWQKPLINLAWRFCRDRGRAEEMAQEVFLHTYRSLAKWRREAAFSTWLFALATNLYRNELKRIPPITMQLDDVDEPPDSGTWGASMEEKAYGETIRRAVIALPAKYRDAIVLFYFHEMNISEAARSLGLPEGTVKIRLSRARAILRKKMSRTMAVGYLREA